MIENNNITWTHNDFSVSLNLAEVGSLRSSVNVSFSVVVAGSCSVTAGCCSSLTETDDPAFPEMLTQVDFS